ncbi:hypothetical protein [Gemmiger sp.]
MTTSLSKRAARFDRICFEILLVFYTLMMLVMFYRQCLNYEGRFPSDMVAYILEMQGLDSGFSFPYPAL